MEKKNFQIETDKITAALGERKPTLLLHSCCGPCSSYVLEYLTKFFDITLLFYGPNIQPREEYELRCFVSGHSSAKLLIDTELWSPTAGEPLAHARLELCALDLQSGRIRKASTVGVSDDIPCEEPLPGLSFTRFPKCDPTLLETVKVRSTNLDYCSHTNNIEYLRFILNTYRAEQFMEHEIEQVEIHYGNQTFEDDEIEIAKHGDGQIDFFSLRARDASAADCMIVWQ